MSYTPITGLNHVYTSTELMGAKAGIIQRSSLTANSTDYLLSSDNGATGETVSALILAFIGVVDASYNNQSFTLTFQNNDSTYSLTLTNSLTDITIQPYSSILIPPLGSATLTFVQTAATPTILVLVNDSRKLFAPPSTVTANSLTRFNGTTGVVVQGSGVTLDNSNNIAGAASLVINGSTSGTVTVSAPAIAGTTTFTLPSNNGTAGYVLSTNGSGITSWISNTSPDPTNLFAYGPAASVLVTSTFTTVNLNTVVVNTGSYTASSGVFTVPLAGVYEIAYTAQFESSTTAGGPSGSFGAKLVLNPSGSPSDIAGSAANCYMVEANGNLNRPSVTKNILVTLASGNSVALQVAITAGTTVGRTSAAQCTVMFRLLSL